MPFIEIRNWPKHRYSNLQRKLLAIALRDATVAAEVPGITKPETVTVTFGGARVIRTDRTIGIIVEFLFAKPERTKAILDRLAEYLHIAAREFFPNEWRIEVMVRPFDTTVGVYRTD